MSAFWVALGFLTTLPVPRHDLPPDALRRAGVWFPVVGLLLGALLAAAAVGLRLVLPAPVAAVLVTVLWVALTGGLHLDGLADCCDGLLPPVARERRLEIMRDPRLGTFGVAGVVLALLLRGTAIATLAPAWPALLLAPLWARWLLLVAAQRPSARPGGMGASMGLAQSPGRVAGAALMPLAVTAMLGWQQWLLWLAVAGAALAALGVLWLAQRRLGGVTGDVFGAVVEVSEVVFLCVACVRW